MSHKFHEGKIYHKRYLPKQHDFIYKFFMVDIDLNYFDTLKNKYFSQNSFNLFSFNTKDHFGISDDFKKNIKELLNKYDIEASSKMRFITLPSILGYVFNPISVLLLFKENKPSYMIAEVHNYNGGRVIYPLKLETNDEKNYKGKVLKDMYVSPFFKTEGEYEFDLTYEEDRFSIGIKLYEENKKMLTTSFVGKSLVFNEKSIKSLFFRHTFLTFFVVTRTIWQSLKLKLKGLKWNKPNHMIKLKGHKMETIWNKLGNKYFSKITKGTLEVKFSDGTTKIYGNNEEPSAKLVLNNSDLFRRLALYGDIGFAESYMDKDFECEDLTALIKIALINSDALQTKSEDEKKFSLYNLFPVVNKIKHILRKNSKTESQKNIQEHYDLSNQFFKLFLDDTMMYSSAVFEKPDEPLFEAQKRKIDILAKKLNLKKGSKVLEIGSGWGAMAMHLVKEYGCEVTTLTLSKEQKKLCEDRFKEHKIDESINIMLKDYRDMQGQFDAVIAVEMFEAVGREYFDVFFKKCEDLLNPHGILVMQIITMPNQRYDAYCKGTDFIQKYIFPGGHLPSVGKILDVTSKNTKLNLLHMEEYTEHYAKTLNIWHENFNEKLKHVKELGFDEYFIRMWKMYLCYCEAAFLTRNINLVQVAFTRYQNMSLNAGLVA